MTILKYSEIRNYFIGKIWEKEYGKKYEQGEIQRSDIPKDIIYMVIFIDIFKYIGAFMSETRNETLINDNGNTKNCTILENYQRLLLEDIGYFHSSLDIEIFTKESLKKDYGDIEILKEFNEEFLVLRPGSTYSKFVTEEKGYEWAVFIDNEIFIKYLWTMKNDIKDEVTQKEVEEVIYTFCENKNIKLDDENFDYYDIEKLLITRKIRWKFLKKITATEEEINLTQMSYDELIKKNGGLIVNKDKVEN